MPRGAALDYTCLIPLAERVAAKVARSQLGSTLDLDDVKAFAREALVSLHNEGKIQGYGVGRRIEFRLIDILRTHGPLVRVKGAEGGYEHRSPTPGREEFSPDAGGQHLDPEFERLDEKHFEDVEKLLSHVALEKDREAMRLLFVEMLTIREAAGRMGVSIAMISRRKDRAESQIRGALSPRKLTDRQREALQLYANGRTYRQIADELHLHNSRISEAMGDARQALGGNTPAHAVAIALRRGLIH